MGKTIKLKDDVYIANELYSTEERIIGKWIDGKPLYKKSVPITRAIDEVGWHEYILEGIIDNYDIIYIAKPSFGITSQDNNVRICCGMEAPNKSQIVLQRNSLAVNIEFPYEYVLITLEYTKTTD